MKNYDATEQAYKNGYDKGYEQGKKDARKKGHWKQHMEELEEGFGIEVLVQTGVMCSECGDYSCCGGSFCKNCGADMRGEEDGS